jgi:flagellar hook-basal body complex protein FliE
MSQYTRAEEAIRQKSGAVKSPPRHETAFADTLRSSLATVNDLQIEKNTMIESFASGETQNVHELMISLQKAGLAVNLTSAVRNKVLEAYKELSRIQF